MVKEPTFMVFGIHYIGVQEVSSVFLEGTYTTHLGNLSKVITSQVIIEFTDSVVANDIRNLTLCSVKPGGTKTSKTLIEQCVEFGS